MGFHKGDKVCFEREGVLVEGTFLEKHSTEAYMVRALDGADYFVAEDQLQMARPTLSDGVQDISSPQDKGLSPAHEENSLGSIFDPRD